MDTSLQCLPKRIPVQDAKFQEAIISDYFGQLIVTPEMVAKKKAKGNEGQ